MKKNTLWLCLVTLLGILLGGILRGYQLGQCINGLLPAGSKLAYGLLGFVVVFVALLAWLSSRLPKETAGKWAFPQSTALPLVGLVGLVLSICGYVLQLCQAQTGMSWDFWFPLLGGISLLCLAAALWIPSLENKLLFLLQVPALLYLVVRLITDYRSWSQDPAVLDFCFLLLASICTMLSLFHLASFSLDQGKRRITVFWSATAALFSGVVLADTICGGGTWATALIYGGMGVYCLCGALHLSNGSDVSGPKEEPVQNSDGEEKIL